MRNNGPLGAIAPLFTVFLITVIGAELANRCPIPGREIGTITDIVIGVGLLKVII